MKKTNNKLTETKYDTKTIGYSNEK